MIERYAPEFSFPAYAFVPRRQPHPTSDLMGHSFGRPRAICPRVDPHDPRSSQEFCFAVDLFNAGYYWEAHEAWEELWIAAGRSGVLADFLKGLIKLAAAGVKAREGQTNGVKRHALRAAELFRTVQTTMAESQPRYCGLLIDNLICAAEGLGVHPLIDETFSTDGRPVISIRLMLEKLDPQ